MFSKEKPSSWKGPERDGGGGDGAAGLRQPRDTRPPRRGKERRLGEGVSPLSSARCATRPPAGRGETAPSYPEGTEVVSPVIIKTAFKHLLMNLLAT